MDLWVTAFWGALGAFVYAAPRLLILLGGKVDSHRLWAGALEFAVSLAIGPIGAAGFTEFIASSLHQSGSAPHRAIAVVLGMIANPVSPTIVQTLGTGIVRRLGAPHMRQTHGTRK
jgi:hypothetical protein